METIRKTKARIHAVQRQRTIPTRFTRPAPIPAIRGTFWNLQTAKKRRQRLEIDQAIYELFDRFELEDKRFLNEVDRHYEHIDLTEAEIEHRAAFPKEPLEEEIGRVLLYEELHKRIAQLTETQQRRLALYYFHGLTYEQIAAAEGCRYQAVRDSVRSAIQKLKNFMSE